MNDGRLIDVFVEQYAALARIALNVAHGDAECAADILQDTAVNIMRRDLRVRDVECPMAFFTTCIKRLAIDVYRKERRAAATDPAALDAFPSGAPEGADVAALEWAMTLKKQLARYPQPLVDAFIRCYAENTPVEFLARQLGMTPNALSQQFRRMRGAVRKQSPLLYVLLTAMARAA